MSNLKKYEIKILTWLLALEKSIQEIGSHLEEQLGRLEKKIGSQGCCTLVSPEDQDKEIGLAALAEHMKSHLDITQERTETTLIAARGIMLNLTKQFEDTQNVLVSISKDISYLRDRQLYVEERLNTFEYKEKVEGKCTSSASDLNLHGTTLLNEVEEENTDINLLKTNLINKRDGSNIIVLPKGNQSAKRIGKRRNLAQARTIIPWEEIENNVEDI